MKTRPPVSSGDLVHRIVIESANDTDDGAGGVTRVWTHVANVSAAIRPRTTTEAGSDDRRTGRATHDVWIRYRDGVTPEMRIRFGMRIFDVLGVVTLDERREWMKCTVEERDL